MNSIKEEPSSCYPDESSLIFKELKCGAISDNQHVMQFDVNQGPVNKPNLVLHTNYDSQMPSSILPEMHIPEPEICYIPESNPELFNAESTDPLGPQSAEFKKNHLVLFPVKRVYGFFPLKTQPKIVPKKVVAKSVINKPNILKTKDKQGHYICKFPKCDAYFKSLAETKLHYDTHLFPENTEYKCGLCNMKFTKAVDRNRHVENHSVAPTHICKICQRTFPYFTVLEKHLQEQECSSSLLSAKCFFCKAQLNSASLIKHHTLTMKKCVCGFKQCEAALFDVHQEICFVNNRKKDVNFCNRNRVKS